jgi:diguanylate cyclase (GGDEF)-like protein
MAKSRRPVRAKPRKGKVHSHRLADRTPAENALRESEQRFRSLTELSSDFYWETDSGHRIVRTIHGPRHHLVNAPGSQIGKARWEIPSVSPGAVGWAAHRAVLDAHQPFRGFEFSRLDVRGAERHLSISGEPVFDDSGEFKGYRGVGQDITERKRAEEELRSTVSLLSATLESTTDGILVVAEDHSISRFNQRFVDMWRIPAEIIESRDDNRALRFVLDQVTNASAFISKVEELYSCPEAESFDTIEFKDGRTFERYSRPQYVSGRPVGRVWSFRDVTERRRAEQRIHALAFHDSLTELPNRVLFRDRMDQAAAHADRAKTKIAFLFLDLDNFKTINDSLGHAVGDVLLKMVAARLRRCVRDTDTISRQGGDEFLIMLTDLPEVEAATPVVQKLMEQFHVPFDVEGRELMTSVSVGIAVYPDDGKDFDALLRKTDTAMYRAKDAGRNAYRFFDPHMNVEAVEHLSMRNGLRFAAERGELVLHYQPQVDLNSGEIVGAEALIRWNHPQLGMVMPARFIPVAEESGLIVPVGEWVLREACRQAAAWRKAGRTGMVVAVNMSAVQFTRGGLDRIVIGALDETGIDPSMLELELTESILIRDTETTLATVKRLKSLGVRLSIDDFGTGYSSLSYLKRFQVDRLKIDQSFIRELAVDPEDAAIVRSIIQMARSLGLRTIAEGVEHESLLHYLRTYHCDEAQGYHFGRPMPAEDFADYLFRDSRMTPKKAQPQNLRSN